MLLVGHQEGCTTDGGDVSDSLYSLPFVFFTCSGVLYSRYNIFGRNKVGSIIGIS